LLNVTAPGAAAVEVFGDPPGKTQEYCAAVDTVLKETDWPAVIVTSDPGVVIVPRGGDLDDTDSCTNFATDGTPAESRRKSM
jgi:hypothetical protein